MKYRKRIYYTEADISRAIVGHNNNNVILRRS